MITIDKVAKLLGFTLSDKSTGHSLLLGCKFYEKKDSIWNWLLTDYNIHACEEFTPIESFKLDGCIIIQRRKKFKNLTSFIQYVTISLEMDEEIIDELKYWEIEWDRSERIEN